MSNLKHRSVISLPSMLCLLFLFTASNAVVRPADAKDEGIARAEALLAAGDTVRALATLDSLQKITKDKGPLYLLRGEIHLARGEGGKALDYFRRAGDSRDREVRQDAWLWLSRTYRTLLRDNYRAEHACRKGLSINGKNTELLFEKALIGFSYGGSKGYEQAGESLVRLIEVDLTFGNAYRMWRDSMLFQPLEEPGRVKRSVERYLAAHPDSARWWVELAWDEFLAGRTDSALAVLGRMEKARPGFNCADRELLLARCRLEAGDSLGFQKFYQKTLKLAAERNEETRAFAETEVAMTKVSLPRWEECFTSLEKASFLRWYWIETELDPIDPLKRRLIEHYSRLRHAELNYSLRNPHSYFQSSENYNRLLAPQSGLYNYDTELMRKQTAVLRLDPRGNVYVRLGKPDKIEKHFDSGLVVADGFPRNQSTGSIQLRNKAGITQYEYWYYEGIPMLFAEMMGKGDYVFIPHQTINYSSVDMTKVLEGRRWIEKHVNYTLEYYAAQFLASKSFGNEVEFYQEDWLPKGERPTATIAVYDSLWGEIERSEGDVFRIGRGKTTDHWLARHRITIAPGKYNYTIRMASKEEKWLGKGQLLFTPFNPDSLQLSAVVLGTEPEEHGESPERMGVRFIPRPTTRFGRGEPVSVYFELYGLQPDSAGRRNYKEWIDVVRLEEGESRIKKYVGTFYQFLTLSTGNPRSGVALSFEREADWRGDRAPEKFILDTSELTNGAYRLVLQVRDNVSGLWDIEEVFFDIEGKGALELAR